MFITSYTDSQLNFMYGLRKCQQIFFIRPPKQVLCDSSLINPLKKLAIIFKGNMGLKIIFYLKYVSSNHGRFEEL